MDEVSNFCPEIAVPITVKMPEPITAPMPSAVSASGPSVFFRRVSGFSESEISLSMDFLANSWLYRSGLLNFLGRHPERGSLIAEPKDLGGPIGAGAPKGRIRTLPLRR